MADRDKIDDMQRPQQQHTQIQSEPQSTSGYFRLVLASMMARYGFRAAARAMVDAADAPVIKHIGLRQWMDKEFAKGDRLVEELAEMRMAPGGVDEAAYEAKLKKARDFWSRYGVGSKTFDNRLRFEEMKIVQRRYIHDVVDRHADEIHKATGLSPDQAKQKLMEDLRDLDPHTTTETSLKQLIESHGGIVSTLKESTERNKLNEPRRQMGITGSTHADAEISLKSGIKDVLKGRIYDTSLGFGSLAITYNYTDRVLKDMRHVFSEVVAYEKGKNPGNVSIGDIYNSQNFVIKDTWQVFLNRTIARVGTDMIFFARWLPFVRPGIEFGDIGLASKGALLIQDVVGRKNTLFEKIVILIDRKLNPEQGLGELLKASDLIDLYQMHALKHQKDAAFQNTTTPTPSENIAWAKSERIFRRMADLMNMSYNYKHTAAIDPVTLQATPLENFTLPKYLYLLGHNMINPYKPEQTLFFVEVFNTYGIRAIKDAERAIASGIPIENLQKMYPVDLSALNGPSARPAHTVSAAGAVLTPSEPAIVTRAVPADPEPSISHAGRMKAPAASHAQQLTTASHGNERTIH